MCDQLSTLPVVQFYLVPSSTGDCEPMGLPLGRCLPNMKPSLVTSCICWITVGGVILDFELAPAHKTDLEVGFEMLLETYRFGCLGRQSLHQC